jgi:tetratricopeptide (TPR) repeat protein
VAVGKAAVRSGPDFSRIYRPTATVADARGVADQVIRQKDGVAARKIGWIYEAAGDTASALPWFQRGLDWAPSAESAKGLAMVLAALGRDGELDALAGRYPVIVTEARGGQVAVAVAREDLPAVLRLTRQTDDPAEMLMRSWTLMKLQRPTEAQLGFTRVMAVADAAPLQRDEAVYGVVRAQIAQHLFQEADRSIERYGLAPERLDEVKAELLSQEVQVSFRQKDYRRTVALLEKRRDYAQPDRALEIQEAWARYHVGEVQTARRIFTRLDRIVSTPETEAGLDAVSRKLGPGS